MSLSRVTLTEAHYGIRTQAPDVVVDVPAGTVLMDTRSVWIDPLTDQLHRGWRTLLLDMDDGLGSVAVPSMPPFFTTEETK